MNMSRSPDFLFHFSSRISFAIFTSYEERLRIKNFSLSKMELRKRGAGPAEPTNKKKKKKQKTEKKNGGGNNAERLHILDENLHGPRLIPYLAMGFVPQHTLSGGNMCGLYALAGSLNAIRNLETPGIDPITVIRLNDIFLSHEFAYRADAIISQIGNPRNRADRRLALYQQDTLSDEQLQIILEVYNSEEETSYRLGVITTSNGPNGNYASIIDYDPDASHTVWLHNIQQPGQKSEKSHWETMAPGPAQNNGVLERWSVQNMVDNEIAQGLFIANRFIVGPAEAEGSFAQRGDLIRRIGPNEPNGNIPVINNEGVPYSVTPDSLRQVTAVTSQELAAVEQDIPFIMYRVADYLDDYGVTHYAPPDYVGHLVRDTGDPINITNNRLVLRQDGTEVWINNRYLQRIPQTPWGLYNVLPLQRAGDLFPDYKSCQAICKRNQLKANGKKADLQRAVYQHEIRTNAARRPVLFYELEDAAGTFREGDVGLPVHGEHNGSNNITLANIRGEWEKIPSDDIIAVRAPWYIFLRRDVGLDRITQLGVEPGKEDAPEDKPGAVSSNNDASRDGGHGNNEIAEDNDDYDNNEEDDGKDDDNDVDNAIRSGPNHPLTRFFDGTGQDDMNRTLDQVLAFNDHELEAIHNYIQTLFPMTVPGNHNRLDPLLLVDSVVAEFHTRPELRAAARRALTRMLAFWGFSIQGEGVNTTVRNSPLRPHCAADPVTEPSTNI
jgi:hypothetical protein